MNIAIIGASAGVGVAAVNEALRRKHHVTAMSRNIEVLPDHSSLTRINGDATVVEDVVRCITKADAVLITIGTKNKKATTLFSQSATALVAACNQINFTGSVIVLTGFGTGSSKPFLNLFMRLVIHFFLKDQYTDKNRMEQIIERSKLKWIFAKPGMLSDDKATQNYRVITQYQKGMPMKRIAREDVAHFLVTQAENPDLLFHSPALSS